MPATFVCDLIAAGASVRTELAVFAASRHVDVAPAFANDEGSSDRLAFGAQSRGLSARCLRFAARLTTYHARLACSPWPTLCCAGISARRVTFKVSALTSLPPRPSFPGAIAIQTSIFSSRGQCALALRARSAVADGRRSLTVTRRRRLGRHALRSVTINKKDALNARRKRTPGRGAGHSKFGVASGLCGPAAVFGALGPLSGKYVAKTAMV